MADSVSTSQGDLLLKMARASIGKKLGLPLKGLDENGQDTGFLKNRQGIFVTLHKKGQLRGCIGSIQPVKPLEEGVTENAVCAAFKDPRFSPLSADEFDLIDIEISLLSKPEALEFDNCTELVALLVPHQHGVIIEKDGSRATFLPQVWEQLPKCEDFLGHLCVKAGLDATAWKEKGIMVYTYCVQSFAEEG